MITLRCGTRELLTASEQIYSQNFETIALLIVACIWYLVLTTIQTVLQSLLERRFEASLRVRPETIASRLWQRIQARGQGMTNVSEW